MLCGLNVDRLGSQTFPQLVSATNGRTLFWRRLLQKQRLPVVTFAAAGKLLRRWSRVSRRLKALDRPVCEPSTAMDSLVVFIGVVHKTCSLTRSFGEAGRCEKIWSKSVRRFSEKSRTGNWARTKKKRKRTKQKQMKLLFGR